MKYFKDSGHLFRFAGLFVIAFLVFWAIRGFVVPPTFGQYGHYRAAAITEIGQLPLHYAGHQACESCHTDVLDVKKAGKHAHVNCEACHGPQEKHAEDPGSVTPAKLDTATLCVRCHAASAARPKNFPQVNAADHSNGMPCETCHQPHSPGMDAPAAAKGGAK
ncbi:MAG: multiheme c-type cytochrome [Terracidiphilus sp.]